MGWLFPSVVATMLGTLLLVLLYFYLYLQDKNKYMLIWSVSWTAYLIRFLFMLVIVAGYRNPLLLIGNQASSLISGVILLWGTYVYVDKKMPMIWILIAFVSLLWILGSIFFEFSFMLMSAPTFVLLSAVNVYTGIIFILAKNESRNERIITGGSFILWGIHKADYPFLRPVTWFAPWGYIIGAFLEFSVAIGIVLLHFQRSKAQLKASNEKMRLAADSAHFGIWELDIKENRLAWDEWMFRLYGISRNDFGGVYEAWQAGVHPDDLERSSQEVAQALRGEKAFDTEFRIVRPDGQVRNLKAHATVSFDRNGEPTKMIGINYDITDRIKAENALRESEEKYRKLVTTAPYGIQLTDRQGKILFSNPAHHKIQGYDDGELVGKYIWELTADDEHQLKTRAYYQKLINQQPVPEVYYNKDLTKDGREIDVQVNWDYLRNSKGEIEGIISIISDITKQKALETSIQQAQKMESIGNLAGGIAHDFNNILFPIIGMAEMLLEDLPQGSGERENAEEIYKAGKRGSELVKQILSFSRQAEHKIMPIRIQNVLNEVIKLSRSTIPTYIEIKQDIQQNCEMVLADPSQIHQIGMNIMTNAYHALADTGGTISVTLRQMMIGQQDSIDLNIDPGAYAVLSISDTGHGMSEELIGKIFDPYFTTKKQGKGTGLGLAVVYGIVKEHKGAIKIYSEIGKGSTFDIYLPLMEKYNGIESISAAEECQGGNERILLVDDEESIIKLEKQMLERLGYKVTTRVNSLEALEAFKARPDLFDLVISDMTMPSMTGDQLAREMTAIRPETPIIICTGFSERLNQERAAANGVKGVLMKPIVKQEMAKTVRKVLDEAKSENQGSASKS